MIVVLPEFCIKQAQTKNIFTSSFCWSHFQGVVQRSQENRAVNSSTPNRKLGFFVMKFPEIEKIKSREG